MDEWFMVEFKTHGLLTHRLILQGRRLAGKVICERLGTIAESSRELMRSFLEDGALTDTYRYLPIFSDEFCSKSAIIYLTTDPPRYANG